MKDLPEISESASAVLLRPFLSRPWLVADLGAEMPVLSFAPHRAGLVPARRIVWREVRDADLPPGLPVDDWVRTEMDSAGHAGAVGMLTARDVTRFAREEAEVEGCRVAAIATVGLGNAERVGMRRPVSPSGGYGTINIAVEIAAGLGLAARIEALTLAAEARTAAVIDAGLELPGGRATGTGTDCIALAAPEGAPGKTLEYAGLHTALGEALGRAVYRAVARGAAEWVAENPEKMRTVFGQRTFGRG